MEVSSSNIVNTAIIKQSKAIEERTLTKREQIATAAMAAVLSRRSVGGTYEDIAKTATRYADALIKELNNGD